MTILVTAPWGNIGRKLLPELMAPELSVRIITRDPMRLPEEIRERVEIIRGSPGDANLLRQALEGIEALFWCASDRPPRGLTLQSHYESSAHTASQAIREAGISRVVSISAIGKGVAYSDPLRAPHTMEDVLNMSGASIRHLRCAPFMENFHWQAKAIGETGILFSPIPVDIPIPMVAVADVADAALRLLVRRDWNGIEAMALQGPEDISHREAADRIGRVLDRPVHCEQIPADDYVQKLVQAGVSIDSARNLTQMLKESADGIARAEPHANEFTSATTLTDWAGSELLPTIECLCSETMLQTSCCCGI